MLTEKQLKGAWLLASGRTGIEACTGAGVTENTLYKWKRKPEFQAAVAFLQEQRESQIQAQAEQLVSLESTRDDEEKILGFQRELVIELGELSVALVRQVRAEGVENIGVRSLPSYLKAFSDAASALQQSNDRLIGLEALINDVEILEQEIQSKAESLEEGAEPP